MVVKTQDRHPGHRGAMGLHVGAENVQQYFPPNLSVIELELDHLQIACTLEPSFWQGNPEIHDSRLSSWLESKRNSGKLGSHDAPVTMIPTGNFAFKLQIGAEVTSRDNTDHSLINAPTPAYFSPMASPAALLDRRQRNLVNAFGAKAERRRIGRLKSDERPSSAATH